MHLRCACSPEISGGWVCLHPTTMGSSPCMCVRTWTDVPPGTRTRLGSCLPHSLLVGSLAASAPLAPPPLRHCCATGCSGAPWHGYAKTNPRSGVDTGDLRSNVLGVRPAGRQSRQGGSGARSTSQDRASGAEPRGAQRMRPDLPVGQPNSSTSLGHELSRPDGPEPRSASSHLGHGASGPARRGCDEWAQVGDRSPYTST